MIRIHTTCTFSTLYNYTFVDNMSYDLSKNLLKSEQELWDIVWKLQCQFLYYLYHYRGYEYPCIVRTPCVLLAPWGQTGLHTAHPQPHRFLHLQ